MRSDVSIADRIGNGIVAGFIATFVMSVLHEPLALLTAAVGMRTPAGLLFHFFVGTLIWGGAFGMLHDWLAGPSWLRGIVFGFGAALIVMFGVAPLTGAGLLCLKLGVWAPAVISLFHLSYGAILGLAYGKLLDTDAARLAAHH